jgi:putative transcriptional regulator
MENNFRVFLAHQRKTIADVHEATGITKTTLTNLYYERSKNPEYKTLKKITDYLNISMSELMEPIMIVKKETI